MELVLLHGFDSRPENLDDVVEAIHEALPAVVIRVLTGPVHLASGDWAWWNDDDESVATVTDALAWIIPQLGPSPVVVAGFSQGAAVALGVAFAGVSAVVGVGCVGGFVPDDLQPGSLAAPLFIAHGRNDNVVDVFNAESLARRATRHGAAVTLALHDGGHAWTAEVTEAFVAWLTLVAWQTAH